MLFSTLVSYTAGLALLREGLSGRQRRYIVTVPVAADLLLLGFFKYANFLTDSLARVWTLGGGAAPDWHLQVILPVGISFYTFHTISYVIDCYRRVVRPARDFWEFATYVSLFSQLVAGPIVRFRQIEADLEDLGARRRTEYLDRACSFFIIGLCQKVLLADSIASVIDPALADYGHLGTLTAWAAMLGYSYQLYFDFAGYSNMAVGLGYAFGIRIPQNFASPYQADGIPDFWRRWHMSLSTCLRDYLYIPLGGSRKGTARLYVNLLLTMLIGGLWHGASWVFVAWGGYHGALLCAARVWQPHWRLIPRPVRQAGTVLLVTIGWVLFRSSDFAMAEHLLGRMFHFTRSLPVPGMAALVLLLLLAAGCAHFGRNTFEMTHDWGGAVRLALLAAFAVCLLRIVTWQATPFLYFQF